MNCKAIPGFPGYEVSDCGRVFSLNYMKTGQRKELKQSKFTNGRLRVTLSSNAKPYQKQVHRLVLEAFDKPCPPGYEACHNDGNPLNNHITNLRWDSHISNMQDRIKHGTLSIGCKRPLAKLSESDVLQIRASYNAGNITQKTLAKQYGVSASLIRDIVNRKLWKHI